MSATDLVSSALLLGASGWLLVRSLWRSKGGCAGCTGHGCGRDAPRAAAGERLVKLGGGRRK